MKKTLQNTTKYDSINMRIPMRQHYKARNPLLSRRRILEPYATDTWFSTTTSYEGYNCAQIFAGVKSKTVSQYGMKSENDGPAALLNFFRQEGVPLSIIRDKSKMQTSKLWKDYCRNYWVKDRFIEPYHSNQDPAEQMMSPQKEKLSRLMIQSGCEPQAWFRAACHVADINNHTANSSIEYQTPLEVRDDETPNISSLVEHEFWDLVYFQDPTANFPLQGGNERLGCWLGRASDYGDKMAYFILDLDTQQMLVRSMV
jgi:hypothetical protein